jgi:acyl transferase domain-containing protein/3-hydroxymyristoyl/3-hydroxydecanoyl-(acyl carrier protein) dehydratase
MSQMDLQDLPIAVVGLGCRMPGADGLDAYWELIRDGRSGIGEYPADRLDRGLYYDPEHGKLGRTYSTLGGIVPDRPLKPEICRLPAELERNTDPAHLTMCEVAAMALRHAGYDPFQVPVRNTGVYVGHSGGSTLAGEYAFRAGVEQVARYLHEDPRLARLPLSQQQQIVDGVIARVQRAKPARRADGTPELGASQVAHVISQAFGFEGPALATDAACASSLIAMGMGVHALRNGLIDMAVVGGASCSKWYALVLFSMAQSISGTGSRPFDAAADGLISSDGYAAVILKTLPRALADGDHIYSVIRGLGISSDGRGKSLWAPRKEGQILAVQRAYKQAVDPSWLQYIECHATSTQVGDSTELSALTLALKDRLPQGVKLPIGSVKANIGHTLESAGIAGFVKTVLCMHHRTIPGQINFQTPNPDVPWDQIPFEVNRQTRPWPEPLAGRPRRAAVNAFGIGGLNVHVVIDDAPTSATKAQVSVPQGLATNAVQGDDAIAIIGMSTVLPGALTVSAFWDLLVSGRDPKSNVPADRWDSAVYFDAAAEGPGHVHSHRGGFVTDFVYDWKKHKVPPKQIANANPLQFMLLDAADQALRDAGLHEKPFDRQRAAVIVGSIYGGDFACDMQMGLRIPEFQRFLREELTSRGIPSADLEATVAEFEALLLKHLPALLDETGSFTASTLASRLTKTFDMMGGAFSLDASECSSAAAISTAMGMLLDQAADVVVCAAGQRSTDINVYEGLQLKNSLAHGDPRPAWSEDVDGILPAEGAAVLILKRLQDAERDGDRIHAVIRGLGVAIDVQHHQRAVEASVQRALSAAGVSPAAISVVEAATPCIQPWDREEARGFRQVLDVPNRPVTAIGSSAIAQMGHTLGVSGMTAVVKATLELKQGQVPAVAGMTRPVSELLQRPDVLLPATKLTPLYATVPAGKTAAVVTNINSQGAVYTLVLEGGSALPAPPHRPAAPAVPAKAEAASRAGMALPTAPGPRAVSALVTASTNVLPVATASRGGGEPRVFRFAAASRAELQAQLVQERISATTRFATGGLSRFSTDGVRLAIVADSAESLEKKLRLTSEQMFSAHEQQVLEPQGIFLRGGPITQAKLAFVFPGQGSQYAGMLQELAAQSAETRADIAEMDDTLRQLGEPSLKQLLWEPSQALGSDVFATQLAMLLSSTLWFRALRRTGLRPDVVCGHSYGEFSALVAAEAMSLSEAIRATRSRTDAVESRESTRGSLLSTTAPLQIVQRLLSHMPGAAYLASHNAPDQLVIGGTSDAIQGAKRMLDAEGFATRVLAVPRPYHTPLLAEAQPAFQAALQSIACSTPRLPVVSSVSLEPVNSAETLRRNLVNQLVTPVRYVDLITRLAQDGTNVFVEVGPGQVLTRLNQRILAGRSLTLVAVDHPKQSGLDGVLRVQAASEVAGWSVHPETTTLRPALATALDAPQTGRILFFDARRKAGSVVSAAPSPVPAVSAVTAAARPTISVTTTPAAALAPVSAPSVPQSDVPAAMPVEGPAVDPAVVQSFMINFVVEQTGYPAEMVELDADLEADLGIDSIKKAQLIGELAENFSLNHLAGKLQDLSLDDFRTLRSLVGFVAGPAVPTSAQPESAPVVAASVVAAPVVAAPVVAQPAATVTDNAAVDPAVVQSFMINFVVEQTGYPAEMVELDADLEADLGIDSIKKAQLIGELAENFSLNHLAGKLQDLSLDDFRTLRSLVGFVAGPGTPTTVEAATSMPASAIAAVAAEPSPVATAVAFPSELTIVPMSGTPYEMGLQHGRSQGPQIKQVMERYAAMLGPRLQNIPELEEALATPTMYFGEEEIEELRGIADGAGLPAAAVMAHNLGMYPDYVPGCTQFAYTRRSNPTVGLIHAVNEDSPLSLSLPDCLTRIVQVRRPANGIPYVTFSVAGQSGGLNGMNAKGLAISSTLLLDRPRRAETAVGKVHPVIVKRLLEQAETIDQALALLKTLSRAGAWSLCLSHHQTDRLCYVEYDGASLQVHDHRPAVQTTNHCLLHAPLTTVPEHSLLRLRRLHELLPAVAEGPATPKLAEETLRDRYDLGRGRITNHPTMNTIRRVDNQISLVMLPESGELHVTPGPRAGQLVDKYFRLRMADLLAHREEPVAAPSTSGLRAVTAERLVINEPKPSPQEGLPAEADRIVQRHVLRLVPLPAVPRGPQPSDWAGAAVILGENRLAVALESQLRQAGVPHVHRFPSSNDPAATIAALQRVWATGPAPHLFLTTARDDGALVTSTNDWPTRSELGVLTPYFVCQQWALLVHQAQLTSRATLTAVSALGGDFGISGRHHGVEGGGMTGLLKAVRRELSEMSVKVIDAPWEESVEALAAAVVQEAADRTGPLEIVRSRGQRHTVQVVPQPASLQRRGPAPHGTWVVTGGARGVTAAVALELGRRFGLTLHLLGSSPEPQLDPSWRNLTEQGLKDLKQRVMQSAKGTSVAPAAKWKEVERALEIDRTLHAFRAAGVTVHYHSCNVASRSSLATTLDRVRQLSGPIHGVLHGAGVEAACRFDKKKRESVEATFHVKVSAAVWLAELTQQDPLDWFVGFGSTSGRFGGLGQTDYSLSSDMLCKLCSTLRLDRPGLRAVGLHWPPWADVGMAARPESKIALQSSNLAFMPPLEGAAHVVDELLTSGPEGELLFIDKPDLLDTDSTMPDVVTRQAYGQRDRLVGRAALVETIHDLRVGDRMTATVTVDPTTDPFLLEHRHQGLPILPAVVGMEAMAEAATILRANERYVVGLKRMTIHQGLRFHLPRPQRLTVAVTETGQTVHAELRADFCDRSGRLVEAQRRQMDAEFELATDYSPLASVDLGPEPSQWTTHRYVTDYRTMKFPEEARVYHGPCFQALKEYALVDGGLWAKIVVPRREQLAGDRSADGWQWPSATIDAGLLAADLMVWNTLRIADLPLSFDQIRLARGLQAGETLTLRVWLKERAARSVLADMVFVDARGHVVIRIDGYRMVEVKTGTTAGAESVGTATSAATSLPDVTTSAAGSSAQSGAAAFTNGTVRATTASLPMLPPVTSPTAASTLPKTPASVGPGPGPAPLPLPSRVDSIAKPTNRIVSSEPTPMPALASTRPSAPVPAAGPAPAPLTGVPVSAGTTHSDRWELPSLTKTGLPAATTPAPTVNASESPLIDSAEWTAPGRLQTRSTFDPVRDLFLLQHTISGKPILPAVIGLETMLQAATLAAPLPVLVAVRNYQISNGLRFRDDTPQSVGVTVSVAGNLCRCELASLSGKPTVYQSVEVEFGSQPDPFLAPTVEQPGFPYSPMTYAEKGSAQLHHGPLFRGLKSLMLQRSKGWAKVQGLAADNLAGSRSGRWILPVATLDSCFVACGVDLFILMQQRIEIPFRLQELRLNRQPETGEACTLMLFYRDSTERHSTYDLVLYGAKQQPLLMIKGYQGIRTSQDGDANLWDGTSASEDVVRQRQGVGSA